MESCTGGGGGGRWRLRQVVPVVLLWMTLHRHVLGCSSTNCNLVLTDAQGEITSPCYPQKYPNSQACRWVMQAPAGFIIQLSFLDFDLEEAHGCIYDRVVVNTGNTDVKFCGLTANGLTLNSTGNVMELSFTSDFSIQKRGFSVSFRHVAVALRNQKVKITGGNGQVTKVANSVTIPTLSQLTICFEVERISQKQKEWFFTYYDRNNNAKLSLGSDQTGMKMIVDGVICPIDSIISPSDFTASMEPFCVLWTSSNGRVAVYFNGNYWAKACSTSSGHSVPNGGIFRLGGQHNFNGNIYNLRLWDYAMTVQQLAALTCDTVGNVIDWDNNHWTIPSTVAQTDATLSCSVSPPTNTPLTTNCDSPGQGCPAASSPATSSTDSTNTIHATNANTHVLPSITASTSTIPTTTTATTSMSLTPTISTTTSSTTSSSSSSVMATTTITVTTSAATPASSASSTTNVASASSTAHAQQTTSSTTTASSATTNHPATNPTTHAEETTVKPPTKASAVAAAAARSSQSKHLAARPAGHQGQLTFGLAAARSSVSQAPRSPPPLVPLRRRTRSAVISSPPRGASLRRSFASSQLKPPAQAPDPPHAAHQPRHVPPLEPSYPRPPASFHRASGHRSSKTSLGFISTPLRKRPHGRRRPVATRAPPRVEVHITKPAVPTAKPISTARPTNTQTSGFKYTAGLKTTTRMLGFAAHATGHLNPTSPPTAMKETATTTQDSELLRQTGVSVSSQGSSQRQHKGEALETKEFTPAVGAAVLASSSSSLLSSASALSNRMNKPVASQWSLLSMSSGENQTVAMGSWTDPLEPLGNEYSSGSEMFVYDLTELVEEGSAFSLYEFDAAYSLEEPTTSPDGKNEQSFKESDPHGASVPVTHPLTASDGGREYSLTQTHFHDDSESLPSDSAAGSKLFLQHSQGRLMPETVTSLRTLSPTYYGFPNNTSSSGQKLKESSYTQAATEQLTFQPSLLIPSLSSLLFIQPTASSPMVPLSPSALLAEEVFTKQIFPSSVPQMEHKAQISISSLPLNPMGSVYEVDITGRDVGLPAAKNWEINNLYPSTKLSTQIHPSTDFFPHRVSPAFPKTSSSDISHHSVLHLILPSLPSLSAPFTSPHAINLSPSSPVSPTGVSPLYSNTLTPVSTSPPFWATAVPLPPSAAPQQPSLLRPSSSQQAERRNPETDGAVESAHVPQSDSVSENFQSSVLSFLSPSSNLQRDFEATMADTASLLSLPHFSEALTESQIAEVDVAVLNVEMSSNNISEPFKSQSLDAQLDSFNQISPTPSGSSVDNLASVSSNILSDLPALAAQLELPELNSSAILWPFSDAVGLSVSQLLGHSDGRDVNESRPAHRSDTGFTSLPTAGIWASERTPALLQANTDRKQDLLSASFTAASSSSSHTVFSTHDILRLDSLSLTVSAETLFTARVTERMMGEETALPSSSLPPHPVTDNPLLLAQTSSSGSQDRYTSSVTFNRDPLSLQHTISHLHIQRSTNAAPGAQTHSRGLQALVDYDSAVNHPTSPLLNPAVTVPTQTPSLHSGLSAQLGGAAPQHASGLGFTQDSGLTQANSEHSSSAIHTHSSAHTHFQDTSQRFAEAHVNVEGLQQQSPHFLPFAPTSPLLSPSILPSLSSASSRYLSHIYPAIPTPVTMSSFPLSSFSTPSLPPLLPSWAALPAVSASLTDTEIGFLSPTWPTAGVNQPTTTRSPLDKYLQFLQRSTTYPISQSTESVEQFIPDSPASTLPDDKLKSSHSQTPASAEVDDKDDILPQSANNSQAVESSSFVSGSVLSPEAASNLSAAGKLSHLSAVFDPADVVPKIHIADEQDSAVELVSSAVSNDDSVTLDVMLKGVTSHQPNEGLNTESFPAEVQTTSPCPTSEPSYQPSSAISQQPNGASVIPNPLHSSGLNIPSSTQASRSPTGFSIDVPNHDFLSGPEVLPANDNHTAGLKYISTSNTTTIIPLKDSPSGAIEMTNNTKATNATTFIYNASLEASQGNVTGNKPIPDPSENAGTSAKSNLTVSKLSLNSNPSMSNHSGDQSSGGFVNGAQDHSGNNGKDENINFSPVPAVAVDVHHFITTKNSSPTVPFKAVSGSVNNGNSSGLKTATAYNIPGSPTVAAKPCQCKQRFHFTCLCGLSSGNSMSCSNKEL
ncbi:adhesion G-protein coupled receptor G6 isoform X2 [Amphiprion ocellaris]|uniref:adhesion G-protein coupled receptor G6 isoform X2 n=1 Tax=Amphiprion ocellaris TaxID=80972 RepID=UPI002410BBB2|nr:adhesion G-protein coupled receptor G6 isoform X2 [Amphiprion ocellaris]